MPPATQPNPHQRRGEGVLRGEKQAAGEHVAAEPPQRRQARFPHRHATAQQRPEQASPQLPAPRLGPPAGGTRAAAQPAAGPANPTERAAAGVAQPPPRRAFGVHGGAGVQQCRGQRQPEPRVVPQLPLDGFELRGHGGFRARALRRFRA